MKIPKFRLLEVERCQAVASGPATLGLSHDLRGFTIRSVEIPGGILIDRVIFNNFVLKTTARKHQKCSITSIPKELIKFLINHIRYFLYLEIPCLKAKLSGKFR